MSDIAIRVNSLSKRYRLGQREPYKTLRDALARVGSLPLRAAKRVMRGQPLTEPTKGRVEIRGRVGSLLEVGTGFHPELTGRENIYLNGAILGMKRAEIDRKFDEIVSFAEIEKFLDTLVKHYSSGMHLRPAFSVAAHLEPEMLLVDEVLAVEDTCALNLAEMGDHWGEAANQ